MTDERSRWLGGMHILVSFLFWGSVVLGPPGLSMSLWRDTLHVETRSQAGGLRSIRIEDPTAQQRLLEFGVEAAPFLVGLTAIWILRRITLSMKHRDPFVDANVTRLRQLGGVMVAGPLVALATTRLLLRELVESVPGASWVTPPFVPSTWLGPLLGALIAFVLAEIFSYGLTLREDVEATV